MKTWMTYESRDNRLLTRKKFIMLLRALGIIVFLALYYIGQAYYTRSNDNPLVQQGVIDLTRWDFNVDHTVKLDGAWQFYWNQLLSSNDTGDYPGQLTGYMNVPGQWNKMQFPAQGVATYRLLVKVKPSSMIYGMRVSSVQMASAVYVNGVKIGGSGQPAMSKSDYTPENKPYTFYFPIEGDTAEIILQAANYDFINGGITSSIEFGTMNAINNLDKTIIGIDVVVIVSLIMVGLYHIGAFLKRRHEQSLLYFGAYCIVAAIAFSCLSERLFTQMFYMLPFELSHKIQLAAIYGSMILITLFIRTVCSDVFPVWFFRAIYCTFGVFILFGLFVPFHIYSHVTFIFSALQIIVYLSVICRLSISQENDYGNFNRQSIIILILAFYALLICLIDNSLFILGRLPNNYLGNISMLVFAILISLMLSFRFSDAYKTIETMSERLLESDRLKDEFLVNTSHELQTPLNGILNLSQSMLESVVDPINEKQRSNLTVIQESARKLSALVHDILDIEKIKRNNLILHMTAVDVRVTVSIVLDILKHVSAGKDIRILNNISDTLSPVSADENRLRQILLNIIGNAIKFTEHGSIVITAEQQSDVIKVVVQDTGIGIDRSEWQRIFQPFIQAEGERAQGYGGVGLGLSVSRQLVHMMNGDIFVEASESGKGTRIAFILPISEEASANDSLSLVHEVIESKTRLTTATETESRPAMFTLLAVDDERANLQVLMNVFSEEEYNLITATNGREALRILQTNHHIDLVLLDVMMPQLSGYEVCQEIRSKYPIFDLPVIMLTVRSTPQDIAAGFAAGANDLIVKPFNVMEVKARVRTLLELKKSVRDALSAEMAFLQSQIKPHFLFNALNAILSVCYTDSAKAAQLINHLSHYLRRSFDFTSTEQFVSVSDEIALVESYVEIEKSRFDERLTVYYDIDNVLLESRILPLTIQPLVENAIRHGIMKKKNGGEVRLSIKANPIGINNYPDSEQEMIYVEIWDNGIGIAPERIGEMLDIGRQRKNGGVGLINIQRRLMGLFGEGLDIKSREGQWTRVQFRVKASSNVSEFNQKKSDMRC